MTLAVSPQNNPSLSVASTDALQAVETGGLVDGDLAYVQTDAITSTPSYWRLDKSSTAATTSGATRGVLYTNNSTLGTNAGRWFRLGYSGLGGNSIMARVNANDATFWPSGVATSKLSCTITTSSTRLWVTYSASGIADGAATAATMQLYVNTGGAGLVALTDLLHGFGGGGTTTTFAVATFFSQQYSRLLTGLTAGVNIIEAYMTGTGGNGLCTVEDAAQQHHAVLRVTEV